MKSSSSGKVAAKDAGHCLTLNKYFRLFLIKVLDMFNSDRILLEFKGSLIIRYGLETWHWFPSLSLSLSLSLSPSLDISVCMWMLRLCTVR